MRSRTAGCSTISRLPPSKEPAPGGPVEVADLPERLERARRAAPSGSRRRRAGASASGRINFVVEDDRRCPIHPEARLRRRHGLVELGDGDRWVARVYVCPVRGCSHTRPPQWIEPTGWQRRNWETLKEHPAVLFIETWPDIIDCDQPPLPTSRLAIEPRPLEDLPWRRWVELAPADIVFPRNGRFHRATCRSLVGGSRSGLTLEEAAVRGRMVPCNTCFTLRAPDPPDPEDEMDEYGFSIGKPWSRNR